MRSNLADTAKRMLSKLSHNSEMRQFEEVGFARFGSVLESGLIEEFRTHFELIQNRFSNVRPELLLEPAMFANDPFYYKVITNKKLLDIAELFVGPDIALFAAGYLCKPPKDGMAVLWHQDAGYWPLEPMKVVSLWVAIDPSTPANGCVRVIPGSHRAKTSEIRPRTDVPNVLSSGMDPSLVNEADAVDLVLAPGDVSVHHPNIIHGSRANTSEDRRCGFLIRYIATSTRIVGYHDKPYPTAYLVRGRAVDGVNKYNCPPALQ